MTSLDALHFPEGWCCYLLLCRGGSYYCGITSSLKTRLRDHRAGRGGAFTRGAQPEALVWYGSCADGRSAATLEKQIKGWSHAKKGELANGKLTGEAAGQSVWVPLG